MKKSSKEIALEIKKIADELGWEIVVRNESLLTITKKIDNNDTDDFVKADGEYYHILSLVPTTAPGSIWGTDGGGVGALSAMKHGLFVMNKSGCSKRVLSALQKL